MRKRFERISAKQRLKRMLEKKAEISPPELQRQVSKDIRDAARKKMKADKSATTKVTPSDSNKK